MKIDVHNHYYPSNFLKKLEKDGSQVGLEILKDAWGRTILAQNGTKVVTLTAPMTDVQARLDDMDRVGFDMQILSLSIPSVDIFEVQTGADLARVANDEISQICTDHPRRFMGFATLPFRDPDLTLKELERCVNTLGFKGACMGSNINGVNLDDERLFPFYEAMVAHNLPIHLHPRAPADKETYRDYRMGPMIGFEVDLCVAVVRLIMGGVLDRFPGLKIIVSHLGGAIPYLTARIENCYKAYPECQAHMAGPPKSYLQQLYYDTVSFFEPALMCAYALVGAKGLIMGSDYPHVIGDIAAAITSIEALSIPAEEKELICSGNILGLIESKTASA